MRQTVSVRRADPGRLLVGLLVAVMLALGILVWLTHWPLGSDSAVYRAGAVTFLRGDQQLYGLPRLTALPSWVSLPFTYPPAAALLFLPLAALPAGLSWGVVSTVSVAALAVVVHVGLRPGRRSGRRSGQWSGGWAATAGLTALALGLEPVWKTLALGQINLILLALVVVDVVAKPRWPGILIGVAAAVKLTPLIFVAHLFVVGRWRDGLRALGTFVSLQALMFALMPHDALEYWTKAAFDPDRIGGVHWVFNQSINGLLHRASHDASWSGAVALVIAAVLAVPALFVVRRLHMRGETMAALLVTAFLGLLASPVSWTHHWVWAVPLVTLLLAKRKWAWAAAVTVFFACCVLMLVPNGGTTEFGWGLGWSIPGNAYVLAAALGILGLAVRELRLGLGCSSWTNARDCP